MIEPAPQGWVVVQAILLAQRVLAVPGDAQNLHQLAAFIEQQAITLRHPDRQAPGLCQRQADFHQADAEQFALNLARGLAFVDDPQFPLSQQPRVSQGQWPERREKQQAAPVNVLPQSRQAAGKKAIGLLRGVLADQLQLAQGDGDFVPWQRRQASEQFLGTFETEAVDGHFEIFRRFSKAAMGVMVGLADDAQGQGGAVLHQFGDVTQRAAAVGNGLADQVMAGLGHRQVHAIEQLHPAFEGGRSWRWNLRFVSHGWT